MPDGSDAAGCDQAYNQKDCAKREELAGTKAIYEGSRYRREERIDQHGEGKSGCRLPATPTILPQDSNVKHPKGETKTQGEKEGQKRNGQDHPTVVKAV